MAPMVSTLQVEGHLHVTLDSDTSTYRDPETSPVIKPFLKEAIVHNVKQIICQHHFHIQRCLFYGYSNIVMSLQHSITVCSCNFCQHFNSHQSSESSGPMFTVSQMISFLQNLQDSFQQSVGIKASEIFVGGSLGQGTIVHEHYDIDLVLYSTSKLMQDLPHPELK